MAAIAPSRKFPDFLIRFEPLVYVSESARRRQFGLGLASEAGFSERRRTFHHSIGSRAIPRLARAGVDGEKPRCGSHCTEDRFRTVAKSLNGFLSNLTKVNQE